MKVKVVVFSVFLLATVSLFGQENESKKESNEAIKYSNITEFGFFATSPRSLGYEATTVNGFSIDQKHCFGIGLGFGYIWGFSGDYFYLHTPVYVNYRLYFSPEKSFSPHLNIALGGVMITEGAGIYSALTMGFKAKRFSFSSGFSFMAIEEKRETTVYEHTDWNSHTYRKEIKEWQYPFGIVLKCGFTF